MSEHNNPNITELASINHSGFIHAFIHLFCRGYRRVVLSSDSIIFQTKKIHLRFNFNEFSKGVYLKKIFGFSFLVFTKRNGAKIQVGPINYQSALTFSSQVNEEWQNYYKALIQSEKSEISLLCKVYDSLKNPRRYPSACLLKPYVARSRALFSRFPQDIPVHLVELDDKKKFDKIEQLALKPTPLREMAIQTFVENELKAKIKFFDNTGNYPLTHEQRLSIVTDEDSTLVLAGAGSGKTSVITTKAIYLTQEEIRKPEEILLITYGKKAADELRERILEKCNANVSVFTFHSLGNRILKEVEEKPLAIADHAEDNIKFRKLIQTILVEDVAKRPGIDAILRKWFEELYLPYKSEWDFNSLNEYYQYLDTINRYYKSSLELRTLKGDKVRSYEELLIANWLYLNEIEYEYEPNYEFKAPESQNTLYRPDFWLVSSGVYIEHFGVRKAAHNGREILTTAPYVNRKKYLEQMEWKRNVHEQNCTILIETYSYEQSEGVLLKNLAEKLAPYATPKPIPINKMFESLNALGAIDQFSEILASFLRLYKSSSLSIKECQLKVNQSNNVARGTAFLKIFEPLFESYEKRLDNRIDFEDMILLATTHLREGKYKSPYKHILVDEFQDIAKGYGNLLLELKNQHKDARIFGVGDDWQSIYRFNGSDIHLMRNFGNQFGGEFDGHTDIHSLIDLAKTFRSVDKIAKPAQSFIQKNPYQIEKQIIPSKQTEQSSIFIVYHSIDTKDKALKETLNRIVQQHFDGGEITVFLLARYKHLIPDNFEELKRFHADIKLEFMTIHRSKGLEADHVIVLEVSSGKWGFPSEIVDDPLLDIVLPDSEGFSHAEERRLLYVALTRAKISLTLLADQKSPSSFIRELEAPEYGTVVLGKTVIASKNCGKCGGRLILGKNKWADQRFECENANFCETTIETCSQCKKDLPVLDQEVEGQMKCSCGSVYSSCPSCTEGWLVLRNGRYGDFYSCIRYPGCNGKKSKIDLKIK